MGYIDGKKRSIKVISIIGACMVKEHMWIVRAVSIKEFENTIFQVDLGYFPVMMVENMRVNSIKGKRLNLVKESKYIKTARFTLGPLSMGKDLERLCKNDLIRAWYMRGIERMIRFREMANSIIHREIFDIKENLKMAKSMGRGRFI